MTTTWRAIGSKLLHYGKRLAPPLISAGLVTWLVWTVSPQKLFSAISTSTFVWLVVATGVQVVVLFAWDTVCLWWLFSQPHRRLRFRTVLRARTDSIIWSAINLEIGQGVFAWTLARATGESVQAALGRCLLLAVFDFGTLTSLALVGSFIRPAPLTGVLRWICVAAVAGLGVLFLLVKHLPVRWHQWLQGQEWARWLGWWNWRRGLVLWALRLVMFLLVLTYAGAALAICHLPVDARTIVGIIPFVLLAESLPGTGGLGERETALVYLLPYGDAYRPVLLSLGLTWSVGVILGRVTIGLVSWCLPRRPELEQLDRDDHKIELKIS